MLSIKIKYFKKTKMICIFIKFKNCLYNQL